MLKTVGLFTKRYGIFLALAMALTLAFTWVETDADPGQSEWVDISGSIFGDCTGEVVEVSGKAHIVTHVKEDNNGGIHVKQHINLNLKGEGVSSGNKYSYIASQNVSLNAKAPYPVVQTVTLSLKLIAKGKADDLAIRIVAHITINANGDVTTEFEKIEEECKG